MTTSTILEAFGTSNAQLRRYFTSEDMKEPFIDKRTEFLKWTEGIINEGVDWSLRNYYLYGAADLMWDAPPILPENIPLTLYAQGRIKIESLEDQLSTLNAADKFIEKKSEDGKEVKKLNVNRLHEVCVNIGRSYLTRRSFAQTNKYNNLFPFFKFDTLSQTQVAKLRGEVMSQYAEMMTNAYGYRHLHTQLVRDMLLYGHSIAFPACSWERTIEIVEAGPDDTIDTGDSDLAEASKKVRLKSRIVREGVPMLSVHPTRAFHDRAYPLASLNTGTGCKWAGFWDVKRFRDIRTNNAFFNRDKVTFSSRTGGIISANKSYFDLYFADSPINFPKLDRGGVGMGQTNDAKANQDFYSKETDNNSVFYTDLRIEVIPKEWGMGDFPKPVILRLIISSDNTVIFAEWMPSSVIAAVFSHNEKDDRVNSLSMAHEIMPWQDQLSNLMSNLLLTMKHSLLRIIAINKDVIDDATIADIESKLNGPGYYSVPHLLKYSMQKYQALGLNPQSSVIEVIQQKSQDDYVNMAFRAIVQILSIVERLMILSPQELGQPAPREITAQEVSSIETATSSVYSAISESVDEGRAAMKRIIYESSVSRASKSVFVPVAQQFSRETIEAAGFKVVGEADENKVAGMKQEPLDIVGNPSALAYDYVFTGRDGGERIQNLQSAQVLVAMLGQVLPLIGAESFGKQRLYDIVNEAFRLMGLYDLKLEINDGESADLAPQQLAGELQKLAAQVQQQLQQAGSETAQNKQQIAAIANAVSRLAGLVEKAVSKAPIRQGEVAPGISGEPSVPPVPLQPMPQQMEQPMQDLQPSLQPG